MELMDKRGIGKRDREGREEVEKRCEDEKDD